MASDDTQGSEDLHREVYARFGLAYYYSEVLHRGLCNLLTALTFRGPEDITRPRFEEVMAEVFSLTLGQLRTRLQPHLSPLLLSELDTCLEKRNFLAHHFWFEKCHSMVSESGLLQMIEELKEFKAAFSGLDEKLEPMSLQAYKKLGFTPEMFESALAETMSGRPLDPLPTQRKLRKQERVVRAWEFDLPNGTRPLIFETDDGELWQLSDVGLGWTYYRKVGSNWRENTKVMAYLPSTFNPRPPARQPWEYEFALKGGAILWVKRSGRARAFRWGVRLGSHRTSG